MATIYEKRSFVVPLPKEEPEADSVKTFITALTELGGATAQGAVLVTTENPALFSMLEWLTQNANQIIRNETTTTQ